MDRRGSGREGRDRRGGGRRAATAAGARRWNDANVLALSLRTTSEAQLREILDAWFEGRASSDAGDRANVEHLAVIEAGRFAV